LTPLFGKQIGDLSGGQKQLVHLASTLLGNPSFLLLDEPTVGLDIQTRKLFWDYIEKYMDENGTVFLATHYIEEAQRLATHLSVLSHGKTVAHGPVAEVVQKVTQNSPLVVELSVEKEHKEAWIGSLKKLGLSPQKSGEHILWPTEKAGDELGKVSELAKNIAGFEGLTLKKPDMEQAYNQLTHTKSPST
jgi:ABC-type multidrug transport system ATPase subunit